MQLGTNKGINRKIESSQKKQQLSTRCLKKKEHWQQKSRCRLGPIFFTPRVSPKDNISSILRVMSFGSSSGIHFNAWFKRKLEAVWIQHTSRFVEKLECIFVLFARSTTNYTMYSEARLSNLVNLRCLWRNLPTQWFRESTEISPSPTWMRFCFSEEISRDSFLSDELHNTRINTFLHELHESHCKIDISTHRSLPLFQAAQPWQDTEEFAYRSSGAFVRGGGGVSYWWSLSFGELHHFLCMKWTSRSQ